MEKIKIKNDHLILAGFLYLTLNRSCFPNYSTKSLQKSCTAILTRSLEWWGLGPYVRPL